MNALSTRWIWATAAAVWLAHASAAFATDSDLTGDEGPGDSDGSGVACRAPTTDGLADACSAATVVTSRGVDTLTSAPVAPIRTTPEIAAAFAEADLPSGFHQAAAEIYRRLAEYKDTTQPPSVAEAADKLRGR